jgi:hypothetical protein
VEETPRPRPAEARPGPAERRIRRDGDDQDAHDDFPRRRGRRDWEPHRGALILTLGILSLVVCQLFGPFAWAMGNQDRAAMRAGRMDPEGEGLTRAGEVCGMIGTILMLVWLFCVGFAFLASLADNGNF